MRCSERPSRSEGTNPASSLLSRNRDVSRFSPAPARPPTNVSHMPGSVDLLAARRAIQSRPSGDQALKCPALVNKPKGRTAARSITPKRRSDEHTSEPQSLLRISYAVFRLQKKKHTTQHQTHTI